ncbi:hypothetical protein CRE_30362 [Caenorhabditis remanei]|uniref:G-protein coupled receptors family 1 profile domain-containing protein n=1 Tax=Caenorhabditis remanei TaxID=31234 RepID=E3N5Z3_CAERE|nr:hypothetical protein CRE_30362 [Caenorhabditis remanei]
MVNPITIDPFSVRGVVTVIFLLLFVLAITFTIILLIVVFPLFLLVFKINKKRDESTSVFPIISHFHKTIILFYLLLLLSICCLVYYIVSPSKTSFMKHPVGPEGILQLDLLMFAVSGLVLYTNGYHIMLSLLAIQRFLFYFYPASAKILNWKQSTTSTVWDCIFLFCCFIPIGFWLICTLIIPASSLDSIGVIDHLTIRETSYSFYNIFYIVINIILFASAVLYIPIVISIRKLGALPSILEFKPHKYVFYQTVSLVSSKIVRFPFIPYMTVTDFSCTLPALLYIVIASKSIRRSCSPSSVDLILYQYH